MSPKPDSLSPLPACAPGTLPTRTDVLIIGGGLLGCAAAYYLSLAGVPVTLIEQGELGLQASSQNAGSLHFQMEYRMIEAGLEASKRALQAMPLHVDAIARWRALEDQLGVSVGVRQKGGFMLAETAQQAQVLEQKSRLENQAGLQVELLDRAALQVKAPYLSDSVLMGAFCADEGKADPRRASLALAAAARALGAQIVSQCQVVDLKRVGSDWHAQVLSGEQCRSKQVLIAAGVWSGRIAQMTGSQLPVSPIALTMTATARTAPFMDYLFQHVGRRLSLKQTAEGTVLIGGGWPSTLHHRNGIADLERKPSLNLDSLQRSVHTACSVVPQLASLPVLRSWTGVTSLVSDQLPLLGQVPHRPGLFIATGGAAFTLGLTYAHLLVAQMLGQPPSLDISAYDPDRFRSLTFA